jgi:hypothetical protein
MVEPIALESPYRTVARGRSENVLGSELSHALPARGPARQRVLRDARAERLPVADGIGASGGAERRRCAAIRTQSGSRHPAAGDASEEAGCEEKEAGCGSGPSGSIAAGGLGNPNSSAGACSKSCAYSYPGALRLGGGGAIRHQLSMAVAIIEGRAE